MRKWRRWRRPARARGAREGGRVTCVCMQRARAQSRVPRGARTAASCSSGSAAAGRAPKRRSRSGREKRAKIGHRRPRAPSATPALAVVHPATLTPRHGLCRSTLSPSGPQHSQRRLHGDSCLQRSVAGGPAVRKLVPRWCSFEASRRCHRGASIATAASRCSIWAAAARTRCCGVHFARGITAPPLIAPLSLRSPRSCG